MNTVARKHESSPPAIGPDQGHAPITRTLSDITLQRRLGQSWLLGWMLPLLLGGLCFVGVCGLLYAGVGIRRLHVPVAGAFAIANYVWWVAIGMGATLISAALYVVGKGWRNSLRR